MVNPLSTAQFATRCVHGGMEPEPNTRAVVPPIYTTTTFVQSQPGHHQGYDYSRAGHPSRTRLESALASLELASDAVTFASGLAAVQAVLHLIPKPGHVLVCDDVYGGTGRLFRDLYAPWGFEFEAVDMTELNHVAKRLRSDTRMVWLETPTNPMLKLVDIAALTQMMPSRDILVVVDNTFATPFFQNPLELGADLVVHSATKYLGGHSDLVAGCVMTRDTGHAARLRHVQRAAGAVLSPHDTAQLHRSLKTLHLRMARHQENAHHLASCLANHPRVRRLIYPPFSTDPRTQELYRRQMRGWSGMISFELAGSYPDVVEFLGRLRTITLAESLGGVESLINHPEQMTHASVPETLRRRLGLSSQLLRLSPGIEAAEDLAADLLTALGSHR